MVGDRRQQHSAATPGLRVPLSFQYIGHDDEFAYARIKVKVTSPGSEGFQDNASDTVTLFHQEGGQWKVWDVYLVGGHLGK